MHDKNGCTLATFFVATLIIAILILLTLFFPAINVHGQSTSIRPLDRLTDNTLVDVWVKAKSALDKNPNPTPEEIKTARDTDIEIFARWANILSLKFAMSTQDEMWNAWFGNVEQIKCRGMVFPAWSPAIIKALTEKPDFDPYFRDLLTERNGFLLLPLFERERYPVIDVVRTWEIHNPRKIIGVKIVRLYANATCYYSLRWNVPPKVEKRVVDVLPRTGG